MSARILVVDDNAANLRMMRGKLEARYYEVTTAQSGPEALSMIEQIAPQIILLDVMMPEMDGFEVCERLKADPLTQHIPVVMLTALTEEEDRIRGLEAGADDFLSKPVDDFALLSRLEALTRFNAVADELRQRESSGLSISPLTTEELTQLDAPANILVIDQDEYAADQIVSNLKRCGHNAASWADGKTALSLSGLDLAVVALSDQTHDPLRLCVQLRSVTQPRPIPIVLTLDIADKKIARKAFSLGAADMVVKPTNVQELRARIRTQVKRSRYIEILRKRLDRGLELSLVDQLTGLYNRRFMLSKLEQWMKRANGDGQRLSVIAFDIDHFKRVNDSHGHEAGDVVLRDFAERIRMNIRPKDIACRLGGEEFLVILPETAGDMACVSAERIRRAIAGEAFGIERADLLLDITVSAGVATYAGGDDTVADILHRADEALYAAKRAGRNQTSSFAA